MSPLKNDLKLLIRFLIIYQSRKTAGLAKLIEATKNFLVDVLMLKRGRFQKHVWHGAMIGLASVGVLTSGVLGGKSLVAGSLPGVVDQDPRYISTFDPFASGVSLDSFVNLKTSVSKKPRSEIVEYEVKGGDTLSGIADKFDISTDTIKWANDLDSIHNIKPGQKLKILPVSGVAVTVKSGDNLESLAKKYSSDPQAILDFPFNDVPDDFRLKVAQILIIPDGHPPDVAAPSVRKIQPQYLAEGANSPAFQAPNGGSFIWPTSTSGISQYFAWYHPGIDLPNRSAPPVVASDGGTVTVAGWPDNYGYGNRVIVDHGNGYQTLYAHLSNIFVNVGDHISRGQTLGIMGSTGRSTGTHLHFEIRFKGIAVNPLAILK